MHHIRERADDQAVDGARQTKQNDKETQDNERAGERNLRQ